MDVTHRGLGWVRFWCSEGPERREHCAVNGSPIVEEDAEDFLREFLVGGGELRGCVFLFSVLYFLAGFWFDVWVRLVMWAAGDGMVELYQCILDVFQHLEVYFPLIGVPVEVNVEV